MQMEKKKIENCLGHKLEPISSNFRSRDLKILILKYLSEEGGMEENYSRFCHINERTANTAGPE
jgi:hypothetical protein